MCLLFIQLLLSQISGVNSQLCRHLLPLLLPLPGHQAQHVGLLQEVLQLPPEPDRLGAGLLVPGDDLRDPPALRNVGGGGSQLDPPQEISLPQLQRHWGHTRPDHVLRRK